MLTDVFLVRHAESASNVEGRLCGIPPGHGLTARGRAQAEAAARQLLGRGVRPGRIVASHLLRAIETAQPLARHRPARRGGRGPAGGAVRRLGGTELRAARRRRGFPRLVRGSRQLPAAVGRADVGGRLARRALLRRLAALGAPGAIVGFSHMHPLIGLMLEGRGRGWSGEVVAVLNAAIVHVQVENGVLRFVSLDPTPSGIGAGPAVAL